MSEIKYKRPPVVERVISMGFSLNEELFQRKLSSWHDIVKKTFPESQIVNNLEFSVSEKNGIPYIPTESQKFTTKYQFWNDNKKNRNRGMQVWRDRIIFNLLSEPGDNLTFEDLYNLYKEWFPVCAKHFEINHTHGVTVEYVNILNPTTVPKFYDGENRIRIAEILTSFIAKGPLKNMIAPYLFEMNFDAKQKSFPLHLHISLKNLNDAKVSLRLGFRASTENSERKIEFDELDAEIHTAHDLIIEEFEAHFTEAAKRSFGII